jgi:hypothetical protein
MVRKTCLAAAALALLGLAAGKPAQAHPRFYEPYGRIFGARTFLCTPVDKRPKDALHAQRSRLDDPRQRLIVSPFFRDDKDSTQYGIGVGYANAQNEWHPWAIQASYFHGDLDDIDRDFDGFEVNGKFILWQPANPKLPVISLVGAYTDFGWLGNRIDALIAVDQCITNRLYITGNVGYARLDPSFGDEVDALQTALGITYVARQNLSFSADYIFHNEVERQAGWSISAIWAIDADWSLRGGGGSRDLAFFNVTRKFDFR